ncbi:MAG: hypothetical protein ABEN55_12155 [Bradymonadaceae bacterium]
MAVQQLKTYDLDEVYCVIGPVGDVAAVRIDGYSGDGGIEFDVQSDLGSLTIGNDGLPVFSRNHDESVIMTISLSEMAKTTRRMGELLEAQRDQSPIQACPVFMKDTVNGDQIEEEFGIFRNVPGPTKQGEASAREFDVILPNAREQIQLAPDINV